MVDPIIAKVRKIPYEACLLHHNQTVDHVNDSDDDGFCLIGRSSIFVTKGRFLKKNHHGELQTFK